jgi:EAL domain-containing protein (putative c-di-GMP-specific phosphodiesterase class I)/CheY-like chemotaxis protein
MQARCLLMLEGDPVVARSVSDAARQEGYGCVAVETDEAFRRAYVVGNPEVIVLDMDPADDIGSGALRFLAEQVCRVPVVLITSFDGTVLDAIGHLARLRGLRIVDVTGKSEASDRVRRVLQSAQSCAAVDLREEMQCALREGRIFPRYQPIFDLRTSAVIGVEALMRWDHALVGLLSTSDFARAADDAGVFDTLGWHVIEQALDEFFALAHGDWQGFLAVNASPRQLAEHGFAERLLRAIRHAGGVPTRVVLEVTESSSMEHPARALALFGRLRYAGVRLALDDFGKGYSSLSLLQRMPFDMLKLDQEFVRRAPASHDTRLILATLIGLGKSLALDVIAEGIETRECLDVARNLGVTLGQGFHLAEPMPCEALARLLGRVRKTRAPSPVRRR